MVLSVSCSDAQLCLTLRDHGLQPAGLLCPWDSPGKNTGVGCHFLLQGIFMNQGSNWSLLPLLHWQGDSLPLFFLCDFFLHLFILVSICFYVFCLCSVETQIIDFTPVFFPNTRIYCCLVAKSCPILFRPHVLQLHGIFQARILEWVAMPSSRGSSQPRDQTQVSRIAGEFFTI